MKTAFRLACNVTDPLFDVTSYQPLQEEDLNDAAEALAILRMDHHGIVLNDHEARVAHAKKILRRFAETRCN